jgi:hypothetical protein
LLLELAATETTECTTIPEAPISPQLEEELRPNDALLLFCSSLQLCNPLSNARNCIEMGVKATKNIMSNHHHHHHHRLTKQLHNIQKAIYTHLLSCSKP